MATVFIRTYENSMPRKQAYRIVLSDGKRAFSLADSGHEIPMRKGELLDFRGGLELGINRQGYGHLDGMGKGYKQLLLTFAFDPKDVSKKPNGDGELTVKRATLTHVEELSPDTSESLYKIPSLNRSILEGRIDERLSFDKLLRISEPKRVMRAKTVRGPALQVSATDEANYYWFNFKSFPSTTGLRHKGYITFFKPRGMIDPKENRPLEHVDCLVDCSCPDYKYRWAWANKQRRSSRVGSKSMNQALNRAPRVTNPTSRPGLCKHLIALRDFIYGMTARFPGGGDATASLSKMVKFAQKRWINFADEVKQAKQKERSYRDAADRMRREGDRTAGADPTLPPRPDATPAPDAPATPGEVQRTVTPDEDEPGGLPEPPRGPSGLDQLRQDIQGQEGNPPENPPPAQESIRIYRTPMPPLDSVLKDLTSLIENEEESPIETPSPASMGDLGGDNAAPDLGGGDDLGMGDEGAPEVSPEEAPQTAIDLLTDIKNAVEKLAGEDEDEEDAEMGELDDAGDEEGDGDIDLDEFGGEGEEGDADEGEEGEGDDEGESEGEEGGGEGEGEEEEEDEEGGSPVAKI